MSDRADRLYDLLPAEFRRRDEAEGFVLQALMRVMGEVYGDLERDIAGLYDSWFVETAPLDRVYAIGMLVGVPTPDYPLPEHRAMVANAISLRRRKGVATAMAPLLRGASGWYAAPTTDVDGGAAAWPLDFDGLKDKYGFDSQTGPADDGMPFVELWAWRSPVFQASGPAAVIPPPAALPPQLQAWFKNTRYAFNSLGLTQSLWNVPGPSLSPVSAGPANALPAALTDAMLAADINRYNEAFLFQDIKLTCPPLPADSLFYGPQAGLTIKLVSQSDPDKAPTVTLVPAANLIPADLSGVAFPPPDFPVFVSGVVAAAQIAPTASKIDLTVDGTLFETNLALEGPGPFTLPQIAAALETALRKAAPKAAVALPAALANLTVQIFGQQLVILTGGEAFHSLEFVPATPSSGNTTPPDLVHQLKLTAADEAGYQAAIRSAPLSTDDLFALQNAAGTLEAGGGRANGFSISLPPPAAFLPLSPASLLAYIASRLPDAMACFEGSRLLVLSPASVSPSTAPIGSTGLLALQRRLGLQPGVAIDPRHGLLALPAGTSSFKQVLVEYGYAFPAAIGGGSYPRAGPQPGATTALFLATAASPVDDALTAWMTARPLEAIIEVAGDAVQALATSSIMLTDSRTLAISAPEGVRGNLCIGADGGLLLSGGPKVAGPDGALVFDGLTIDGGLVAAGGLLRLSFTDCTLYPAPPSTPSAPPVSLSADAPGTPLNLTLERCLSGALALADGVGAIAVLDTVVGGLASDDIGAVALAGPSVADRSSLQVQSSTILGATTTAAPLTAVDTLFAGVLQATGGVSLRCCFVSLAVIGPRAMAVGVEAIASGALDAGTVQCSTCGKPKAVFLKNAHLATLTLPARFEAACACADATTDRLEPLVDDRFEGQLLPAGGLKPVQFYEDGSYPSADFGRLCASNAPEILTGSSIGGEVGAYGLSGATQKRGLFLKALRDNLPMGAGFRVHYRS